MNNRPTSPGTAWVVFGAAVGLVTWLYDYDFFLNAGGPQTLISNAILRATGTASGPPLVIVLWPAALLVLLGMVGGFLVSRIVAVFRRKGTR
jgi:hypothetical protein